MDTIAAIATPTGEGGVAVIRISGPEAGRVLLACTSLRRLPPPRRMTRCRVLLEGEPADEGLAVFFPGPHSYTGEDTAELQVHGGRQTAHDALQAALEQGARMARPGEFTRRAFESGKMDLSQAEAVMDLVQADSQRAARLALDQLQGSLGKRIACMRDRLLDLLARVEAAVDYAQEELLDLPPEEMLAALREEEKGLDVLLETARTARVYKEGIRCALAGLPNAGKSSLLNALLGEDRAIVTEFEGTTRDTLEAEIRLNGLSILLTDTAGLRETGDIIEALGVERAREAIRRAQLTLFILDASRPFTQADRDMLDAYRDTPHLLVLSKWDKTLLSREEAQCAFPGESIVCLSSLTGQGLQELRLRLEEAIGLRHLTGGEAALTRQRHVECVRNARECLRRAAEALAEGFPVDIASGDLRRAWHSLGEITGDTVDEDVIDRIFEKFCLGK